MSMKAGKAQKGFVGLLLLGLLTAPMGCAHKHGLHFDHQPLPPPEQKAEGVVSVRVIDARPVVKSGEQPGCFLGTVTSAAGMQAELYNGEDGVRCDALAVSLGTDLEEELQQLGFHVGGGGKTLRVVIVEWEFDGFFTGMASYQVDGTVLSEAGEEVASSRVRDTLQLPGARTGQSKIQAMKQLPGFYDGLVDALLRNNDELLAALR